jgi:hypothetical protein
MYHRHHTYVAHISADTDLWTHVGSDLFIHLSERPSNEPRGATRQQQVIAKTPNK